MVGEQLNQSFFVKVRENVLARCQHMGTIRIHPAIGDTLISTTNAQQYYVKDMHFTLWRYISYS